MIFEQLGQIHRSSGLRPQVPRDAEDPVNRFHQGPSVLRTQALPLRAKTSSALTREPMLLKHSTHTLDVKSSTQPHARPPTNSTNEETQLLLKRGHDALHRGTWAGCIQGFACGPLVWALICTNIVSHLYTIYQTRAPRPDPTRVSKGPVGWQNRSTSLPPAPPKEKEQQQQKEHPSSPDVPRGRSRDRDRMPAERAPLGLSRASKSP